MPQARDEAGNIWETDAQGNAVRLLQPANQMPANPSFPYEGPKAAADAAKAAADAAVTTQTAPSVVSKTAREAATEGLTPGWMWNRDGTDVIRIPGYQDKPSDAQVARDEKTDDRKKKADVVRRIMGEVRTLYNRDIKGQPASRAFGATEYIDGLPANEEFRVASENILPLIRPMIAQTAREGDSDKEMQIFLSYIPSNDDTDRTVERKLKQLEFLIGGLVDGKPPSTASASEDFAAAGSAFNQDNTGGSGPGLSGGGDRKSIPIPPAMQREYEQYVQANRGRLDPQAYATFRASLDEKYGFGNPGIRQEYLDEAKRMNEGVDAGGRLNLQIPPIDAKASGIDQLNATMFNNPVGAAVLGAGSLGGGLDEIAAAPRALLNGTDYSTALQQTDAMRSAASDQYPGSTILGNLIGAGAGGYGLGRIIPGAATSTLGKMIATGSAYGAGSGALEMNDNRAMGAVVGTGAGAAGGSLGYGGGRLAERLLRGNSVPKPTASDEALGVMSGPINNVRSQLSSAADLNMPYALADADPRLRALAGAVSRKSIGARELAENTFEPRSRGQAERAQEAIDSNLAPYTDVTERGQQWRQAAQTASAPFYAAGRQRAAPVDPRVDAFLQTPAGRTAMSNARDIAGNEGRDVNALGFDLDERGEIVLREVPSWETLDYIKRGFDQQLNQFRDPNSGKLILEGRPDAQALEGLRRRFVSTLDELNPDYKAARDAYEGQIRNRNALEMGVRGANTRVKPNDLDRITQGLDPAQLDEYRRGYASTLSDSVGDVRLTGNPYERVYGSTNQQAKIGQLFPEGAQRFGDIYGMERDMAKTAYETLGGSPTQARHMADQQLGDVLGSGMEMGADIVSGGGFSGMKGLLSQSVRQAVGDAMKVGIGKRGQQKAERIAPVLFNTNPRSMLDAIDQYSARQSLIDERRRTAQRYGGLFGAFALPATLPMSGP